MRKQRVAALTSTSRKYCRGPRGAGFLAVRREWMDTFEPAYVDVFGAQLRSRNGAAGEGPDAKYENVMSDSAARYEQYERNYAVVAGFSSAVQQINRIGIHTIWERISSLAERLRALLRAIDGVTVWDTGRVRCGLVSFTTSAPTGAASEAQLLKDFLAERGILIHTSRRPSSIAFFDAYEMPGAVCRASVHYYNTHEELDRLAAGVRDFAARSV